MDEEKTSEKLTEATANKQSSWNTFSINLNPCFYLLR